LTTHVHEHACGLAERLQLEARVELRATDGARGEQPRRLERDDLRLTLERLAEELAAHDRPGAQAHRILGRQASCQSEEHTSELQSRENLVCRLLLEKKNNVSRE